MVVPPASLVGTVATDRDLGTAEENDRESERRDDRRLMEMTLGTVSYRGP